MTISFSSPRRPAAPGQVEDLEHVEPVERAFTILEVMMAATILALGFMGLIEAVGVTSNMMDHARRQTLATQIINHEIENLRMLSWDVAGSTNDIVGLPTASTAVAIDPQFWPVWSSTSTYVANNVVSYSGAWYRCILAPTANQIPTNTTYWTSVLTGVTTDILTFSGANYALARTVTSPDPVTNIREVNFTVTWIVKTNRRDASNNPLSFTYTRSNSAWFGKYGLNLSYQRS